jgi:hypothetical protein
VFNAPLFFLIQSHHHQGGSEQLREYFERAKGIGHTAGEQQLTDYNRTPGEK